MSSNYKPNMVLIEHNPTQEMGNFCEAFGFKKIEAPSTKRKRFNKRKGKPRRPFQSTNFNKEKPTLSNKTKLKVTRRNPKTQKKPIVCYKCGKASHKSFHSKMKQKINELFAEDYQMKSKLLSLLIQDHSEQSAEDNDYYSDSQNESEYESSSIPVINVITNKSQKEFLLDLIGQIPDGNLKNEYLEKLKALVLEEEDKTPKFTLNTSSSSLTNIYK